MQHFGLTVALYAFSTHHGIRFGQFQKLLAGILNYFSLLFFNQNAVNALPLESRCYAPHILLTAQVLLLQDICNSNGSSRNLPRHCSGSTALVGMSKQLSLKCMILL